MRCIDYRPTVVVTGQSALHLALPIAFKHNIPLAMIEAHGPLNAIKLNASAAASPIHACIQRLAWHEKARTGKQVELANALLRSREYDGSAARKIPLARGVLRTSLDVGQEPYVRRSSDRTRTRRQPRMRILNLHSM